ncbi:30S ribosomal protein S16 [Patescibacteria group bacterium]|nr:30S ribosomal protein S16 [Patescibacteria group bacterium]MBU1931725.1 30S ribosomal protein S16 [Patescibacteria group bacterium]
MLKIKLTRTGKRNQPSYRFVVVEARSKRDGKYLESLGFYNPLTEPATIKINQKRLKHWLSCGAQPTETVRKLILKEASI